MTLAKHIDADNLEDEILLSESPVPANELIAQLCGTGDKHQIPTTGQNAAQVYQSIHDDLALDGSTTLNLASFVNTHVEPEALKLVAQNLTKNLADNDEYPALTDLQQRCVDMLSTLWHAPRTPGTPGTGAACTGSSEAIMLGGLAMKKNWQARRRAAGLDIDRPNVLMASCCQVAIEKFARYFDVEARVVSCSGNDFLLDYELVKGKLDERTIGVFVIMGSTYTGGFESVKKVTAILDAFEKESGIFIPIHVDGASGGLIASIVYPEVVWDFKVNRVVSINCSGHKFGLTTAGLGWVIFRDQDWLPEELKFELQYLGGVEESFNLNFSRPGFQVIHQYYNFLRLGLSGYYEIFSTCLTNARILSNFVEKTGYFKCVSNLHLPNGITARGASTSASASASDEINKNLTNHQRFNPALPVVSFQFSSEFSEKYPEIPQSVVSTLLRNRKWIIPNYSLPKTTPIGTDDNSFYTNNEILRVVVKYNLTSQLLDKLMHDVVDVVELLIKASDIVSTDIAEGNLNPESSKSLIYNLLVSIATDGNEKLMKLRKIKENHENHVHSSFRGPC